MSHYLSLKDNVCCYLSQTLLVHNVLQQARSLSGFTIHLFRNILHHWTKWPGNSLSNAWTCCNLIFIGSTLFPISCWMSDSNIDITTHSCLTYLQPCPVCSNWRSIRHTQQSAMWALRPSSWIYTHSALVYTVIPEVFGVSRKRCSILATSQKHKINPLWFSYSLFIYSNSSMHPWHLWVLQQHLKVYRHMTCCRIPNIPVSLGLFFFFFVPRAFPLRTSGST